MSRTIEEILEYAEEIVRDERLSIVREWCERTGAKAVGCMPVWSPRELLHAAGILPVGIVGGGDNIEIIRGDAYFQSYICQIPRSTIELGLNGALEPLSGMVFPSICDVIRNLSGMWKMLFPDRAAWYLDMPQSFDEIGIEFFAGELRRLLGEFSELSGKTPTDDEIRTSLHAFNRNRQLIEDLFRNDASGPGVSRAARATSWLAPVTSCRSRRTTSSSKST